MSNRYFSIPIKFNKLISNNEHYKCDIKESIAHNIRLISTSSFGECTFDETFGCAIWDVDFDNLSSTNKIKEIITKSLYNSISKHEKRIAKLNIEVTIKQEEITTSSNQNVVKKKISIEIKGVVIKTNEPYFFEEFFYIGPLSY